METIEISSQSEQISSHLIPNLRIRQYVSTSVLPSFYIKNSGEKEDFYRIPENHLALNDVKNPPEFSNDINTEQLKNAISINLHGLLKKVSANLNKFAPLKFECLDLFNNVSNSLNNIIVEQPNIGPCSCFICGSFLGNSKECFNYLKSQKLFNMQISVLQLLSNILSQWIITNTESVDLCRTCSVLVNEADSAYKRLSDLRQQLSDLFTSNKRPKITYHSLPKSSSLDEKISSKNELNLADLALTRPRRGKGQKSKTKPEIVKEVIKKKGGRPRKPHQCKICRRKFITLPVLDKHMNIEHRKPMKINISKPFSDSTRSNLEAQVNFPKEMSKKAIPNNLNVNLTKKCYQNCENKSENVVETVPVSSDCTLSQNHSNFVQNSALGLSVRPIQPKPETIVETGSDGSLIFIVNPVTNDHSPALIKVSPDFFDTKIENPEFLQYHKMLFDEKTCKMHHIATHDSHQKKGKCSDVCNEDQNNCTNKALTCKQCSILFSNRKLLTEHKESVHTHSLKVNKDVAKEKLYSCDHCSKTFEFKYEIESHRESHLPFNQTGPHEFVCNICGLKVASKPALKIHFHRFHNKEEIKELLCAKCGYMTNNKKAFSDHLRIHNESPEPKTQCHLCQKEMLPSSHKIHMLRMHGEARYPCDTCGQRFTVRSDLMKHINTVHSALRPYTCNICNLKFATSVALRYHRNKLHSNSLYFCEVCGKCCRWKGELRSHMNKCHSSTKANHPCNFCPQNFNDKRKLQRHLINKHNVPRDVAYLKNGKHSWTSTIQEKREGELKLQQEQISSYENNDTVLEGDLLGDPITAPHSEASQVITTRSLAPSMNTVDIYQSPAIPLPIASMDIHVNDHQLQHTQVSPHILAKAHPALTESIDSQNEPLDNVNSIYLFSM